MKQVIQNLSDGQLKVEDVPIPQLVPGGTLVHTTCSLISAGTEKTTVDVAQKNLLQKARARPDLVRKVVDRVRKEGVLKTLEMVRGRLSSSVSLGYSCAGRVVAVADEVEKIRIGDRVACAGAGYASHAEVNFVPGNLVARIPEGVSHEEAAFTTVASIALQGVRLAEVELGQRVAVIGLGLVGQIAVQLLKAAGCMAIGMDIDPFMVDKANECGVDVAVNNASEDVEALVAQMTDGYGVDATLITAATSSNVPIELAGQITREKGRVVVVGAVGLKVPREPYYMKEIDFVISRSYGPGRYDPSYEEGGVDYPYAYVRFTEQRNMQTVLELMAQGKLDVKRLITHRFPLEQAAEAYELIKGTERKEPYLGILLEYGREAQPEFSVPLASASQPVRQVNIGIIGAGNYATANLLPELQKNAAANFRRICTASGVSAKTVGERVGFTEAVSSPEAVLDDEAANLILIATRHDGHAPNVIRALESGKHVFVEKPLCLTLNELENIEAAYRQAQASGVTTLTVGFNRRFAPLTQDLKSRFDSVPGPRIIQIRVNAGPIPKDHWLNDPVQGGGRLVGEGCHFIDLFIHMIGKRPKTVFATGVGLRSAQLEEDFSLTIRFEDGSIGTMIYTALGNSRFPKEHIEIYAGGAVGAIDDFRTGIFVDGRKGHKLKGKGQDKGQGEMLRLLVDRLISGGAPLIPYEQLVWTTRTSFAAVKSLALGRPVALEELEALQDEQKHEGEESVDGREG